MPEPAAPVPEPHTWQEVLQARLHRARQPRQIHTPAAQGLSQADIDRLAQALLADLANPAPAPSDTTAATGGDRALIDAVLQRLSAAATAAETPAGTDNPPPAPSGEPGGAQGPQS